MYKRILISITLVVFAIYAISCSQTNVRVHKVDEPMTKDGVFYTLPKTVLTAKVPITRTTQTEGEFANCVVVNNGCDKSLETIGYTENKIKALKKQILSFRCYPDKYKKSKDGPICVNKEGKEVQGKNPTKPLTKKQIVSYSIEKPTIGSYAIADNTQTYMAELEGGYIEKRKTVIKLTEAGIITNFEATVTDQSFDLAVKTLEAASSIIGTFVSPGMNFGQQNGQKDQFSSDTSCKANQIIKEIASIQLRKKMLLGPSEDGSPHNLESLKFILDKLSIEEKSLKSMLGVQASTVVKWEPIFKATPFDRGDEKNCGEYCTKAKGPYLGPYQLFKITKDCAVEMQGKNQHLPVNSKLSAIDSNKQQFCKGGNVEYALLLDNTLDGNYATVVEDNRAMNIPESNQGFRYRIPVRTLVKFTKDKTTVATNVVNIAQFGTVATLPASLGPGETIYLISLYEDTGALKSIDTTSSTINPETLGNLGTAASGFVKSTHRPKEDEKTDIEKKQEEKTERELDVAIELLKLQQKELGILEDAGDSAP